MFENSWSGMMGGHDAIVTGGGTGIGAGVIRALAVRGVQCVINYANSRDEAEALAVIRLDAGAHLDIGLSRRPGREG